MKVLTEPHGKVSISDFMKMMIVKVSGGRKGRNLSIPQRCSQIFEGK